MITTTRQQRKALEHANAQWPVEGRDIPREQWPADGANKRMRVMRSRDFLVQAFQEPDQIVRLSINRTTLDVKTGRWDEAISWDELQAIKDNMGYGAWWGVEVFPAETDVVNVANMRHLWLSEQAPSFAWRRLA